MVLFLLGWMHRNPTLVIEFNNFMRKSDNVTVAATVWREVAAVIRALYIFRIVDLPEDWLITDCSSAWSEARVCLFILILFVPSSAKTCLRRWNCMIGNDHYDFCDFSLQKTRGKFYGLLNGLFIRWYNRATLRVTDMLFDRLLTLFYFPRTYIYA